MRAVISAVAAISIAATVIPIQAHAAGGCERRAHRARVTGTVLGAIGGALLGNAISHRGGAVVGGVGGAVVGNQLSRRSCDRYGYHYRHYSGYTYRHSAPYGRQYGYRRATTYAPQRRCAVRTENYYNDRGELVSRQVESCA